MTDPEAHLRDLLGALGAEESREPALAEEARREERLAAHIDRYVASLHDARSHQPSRLRRWSPLLVAALFALAGGFVVWKGGASSALGIAQEPLAQRLTHEAPVPLAVPAPSLVPLPAASSVRAQPARLAPARSAPVARVEAPNEPPDSELEKTEKSTLSEENRLFKQASEAERSGQTALALIALNQLLSSFPGSPLAQNAMVQRFRLLSRAGQNAEGLSAARAYLSAFPQGFAQAEAQSLVTGHVPESEISKETR